jgi:hypothetical protein
MREFELRWREQFSHPRFETPPMRRSNSSVSRAVQQRTLTLLQQCADEDIAKRRAEGFAPWSAARRSEASSTGAIDVEQTQTAGEGGDL